MSRPRAWVTGAGGLLGDYLARLAREAAPGWEVVPLTRAALDLLDFAAVRERFTRERPRLVLHCAALSRSPDCEADPALARRLNVDVPALLAELAERGRLVSFSTDLVFDGRHGHYAESDDASPLGVYGATKLAGERAVVAVRNHIVLRTSLNAGVSPTGDRAFNEALRRAWMAGQTARLFTDEFRSPIPAEVTARAAWELALRAPGGVYHVGGAERLSRWEIGQLLAARWPELRPKLEPASIRDFTGPPRPADTSLNSAKAQAWLSFPLPGLGTWLAAHPDERF